MEGKIPEISDQDLLRYAEKISAVRKENPEKGPSSICTHQRYRVLKMGGTNHPSNIPRLRRETFILDKTNYFFYDSIEPIVVIDTYHPADGFFSPTMAEVIAQIPKDTINKVIAFEINLGNIKIVDGAYLAQTTLFAKRKKSPT